MGIYKRESPRETIALHTQNPLPSVFSTTITMLSSILLGLCGAAAVAAAPHPFADYVRDGKIMVLDEHGQGERNQPLQEE